MPSSSGTPVAEPPTSYRPTTYTVRDGKIVRYELENLGESELERAPSD
jgi:hypothetical protein